MAYKRNINRLPIPPKNAKIQNVVCHYCIVGCGYRRSWPVDQQGGRRLTRTSSASIYRSNRVQTARPGMGPRCTTS